MKLNRKKIALGIGIIAILALAYAVLWQTGILAGIVNGEELQERLGRLGFLGPFAIVELISLAIVFSPIPSAPIALAAGAAYGHLWGTVYVVIGAETGALMAFVIARLLGHAVLLKWFGERLSLGLLGSQNTLMGLVFISRLLPFLSFDLVSYAAGLTVLSFWRFVLATVAGIIPASFLLAHFGDEMATGEGEWIMISIGALGVITFVPLLVKLVRDRLQGRNVGGDPVNIKRSDPS